MELKFAIKTPDELLEIIEIAKRKDTDYVDAIWAIHKYKWYNWYQNIYIKADSPEDKENTKIFEALFESHPEIDADIEANITYEIKKLEKDSD